MTAELLPKNKSYLVRYVSGLVLAMVLIPRIINYAGSSNSGWMGWGIARGISA